MASGAGGGHERGPGIKPVHLHREGRRGPIGAHDDLHHAGVHCDDASDLQAGAGGGHSGGRHWHIDLHSADGQGGGWRVWQL